MSESPFRHHLLVALCFISSGASYAQADKPICATANADVILRTSAAAKAAQQRLAAEFKPQEDAIEPLSLARSQTEVRWREAKRDGRPGSEIDSLKEQYEQALSAERKVYDPLRQALDRRKREEIDKLVKEVNAVYKRLGIEQGFKLLLQQGDQEPAYVLKAGTTRAQCTGEIVDLTSEIIRQMDRGQDAKP